MFGVLGRFRFRFSFVKSSNIPGLFLTFFGKFLVLMKLGKKCVILGKKYNHFEKNSAILINIGKMYLLNWDFSANWEKI